MEVYVVPVIVVEAGPATIDWDPCVTILPEGPIRSELCLFSTGGAGTASTATGTISSATTIGSNSAWTSPPSAAAVIMLPSGPFIIVSELGPLKKPPIPPGWRGKLGAAKADAR